MKRNALLVLVALTLGLTGQTHAAYRYSRRGRYTQAPARQIAPPQPRVIATPPQPTTAAMPQQTVARTAQPAAQPATKALVSTAYVTGKRYNLPNPGQSYTIKQLLNYIKGFTGTGFLSESANFMVLTHANGMPVKVDAQGNFIETIGKNHGSVGVGNTAIARDLKALENMSFKVRQDAKLANHLASDAIKRVNPLHKNHYTKMLSFIVVQIKGKYYKLYLNNPWPFPQVPATARTTSYFPSDQTVAKYFAIAAPVQAAHARTTQSAPTRATAAAAQSRAAVTPTYRAAAPVATTTRTVPATTTARTTQTYQPPVTARRTRYRRR